MAKALNLQAISLAHRLSLKDKKEEILDKGGTNECKVCGSCG